MHAFLLMVYMGQALVSKDMYFRSIDDCLYFAERLNNQPTIPQQEGKNLKITAYCKPRRK